MAKTKISEYSSTANSNTDIASINIDEGCAPSGINNAIRAVMGHLKDFQSGTNADPFNGPVNGTLGATTPAAAAVTTLTTSSTVTHNGGTANGVAYLNGSKVLTTGSALVFDGSNLGLGVTPSAWGSGFKALQVKNASLWSTGNDASLTANAYYDGTNYKYIGTNGASRQYHNTDGSIAWSLAPSGTAGNAISFTQAMTLNANGQLLIGATSSGSTDAQLLVSNGGANGLEISATAVSGQIRLLSYNRSTSAYAGAYYAALDHKFDTGGAERARITPSGQLLVKSQSSLGSQIGVKFAGVGVDGLGLQTEFGSTGSVFVNFYNSAGTQAGYIAHNGTTTVNYVTSSDVRLKTNIVDANSAKAKIEAIKIRQFDWLSGEHQDFGVVAQELFDVAPEAVSVGITEEKTWGVDYSKLVPSLIKYVQEQQAMIEAQAATIANVESNNWLLIGHIETLLADVAALKAA